MKSIFIAFLLLFSTTCLAQSHNLSPNSFCKFVLERKRNNREGHAVCPACDKEDKLDREARIAEQKRGEEVKAAAVRRKYEAEQAALRQQREAAAAKRNQQIQNSQVVIGNPVQKNSGTKKTTTSRYYEVKNSNSSSNTNRGYAAQILYNGKVIYETDQYYSIRKVYEHELFVATLPYPNTCSGDNSNNEILIDKNGKQIVLNGIKMFGVFKDYSMDDRDHFELIVYDGSCSPIYNDNYDKSRWPTTVYRFSFSTLSFLSTASSAMRASCPCD